MGTGARVGFADVEASTHPEVAVGARLFGYLPMGTHLMIRPGGVDDQRLIDTADHRASLPIAYNTYRLVAGDPLYAPGHEDAQSCSGRCSSAFVLDRFLATNEDFGASTVGVHARRPRPPSPPRTALAERGAVTVTGLTSPGNVDLGAVGTGHYDRVVAYEAIDTLPVEDAVYVDFAGDTAGFGGRPRALRRPPGPLRPRRWHPLGPDRRGRGPRAGARVLLRPGPLGSRHRSTPARRLAATSSPESTTGCTSSAARGSTRFRRRSSMPSRAPPIRRSGAVLSPWP